MKRIQIGELIIKDCYDKPTVGAISEGDRDLSTTEIPFARGRTS